MLFPTAVFALFFFVVFHVHWALRRFPVLRKCFLLGASLFFYGYWSWKFALMLVGSSVLNHAAARLMVSRESKALLNRKAVLVFTIIFNIGLLAVFKYTGFVVDDVLFPVLRPICFWLGPAAVNSLILIQEKVYPLISSIVLPVGISFFTFQALSYVIDTYRGISKPAKSWLDFANYLAFFPQLVAGPIVRASVLVPQMEEPPTEQRRQDTGRAAFLIVCGLFKKTVIANWIAVHLVDPVFAWPGAYSGPDTLLGVYGYAVQIYCDFSAYSDIAIGTALLMGFKFPDNFNAPYLAVSLRDFWRRWHISLSTWLRDYLYIPMGGSRYGSRRTAMVLLATFLLGGLWHGASWTFVLWGLFHGISLVLERLAANIKIPARLTQGSGALFSRIIARIWVFHVVCVSWILFRGGSLEGVRAVSRSLFAWQSNVGEVVLWNKVSILVVAIGFASQLFDGQRLSGFHSCLSRLPGWLLGVLIAVVLTVVFGLGPEGVAPFIYFQF